LIFLILTPAINNQTALPLHRTESAGTLELFTPGLLAAIAIPRHNIGPVYALRADETFSF
jgi:hypothetical protein